MRVGRQQAWFWKGEVWGCEWSDKKKKREREKTGKTKQNKEKQHKTGVKIINMG